MEANLTFPQNVKWNNYQKWEHFMFKLYRHYIFLMRVYSAVCCLPGKLLKLSKEDSSTEIRASLTHLQSVHCVVSGSEVTGEAEL